VPAGLVIAAIISNSFLYLIFRKKIKFRLSFPFSFKKSKLIFVKYYNHSWAIALSSVCILIYYSIDIVYLKYFRSEHEVGIYSAAVKTTNLIISGLVVINQAVYPRLSSLIGSENYVRLKVYFKKWLKNILIMGSLVSITIFFTAEKIIKLIFGVQYNDSALPLKILGIAIFFVFGDAILAPFLYAANKTKQHLIGASTGAILSILLNPFFIMHSGYLGCSVVRLLSEILIFSILLFFSMRELRKY